MNRRLEGNGHNENHFDTYVSRLDDAKEKVAGIDDKALLAQIDQKIQSLESLIATAKKIEETSQKGTKERQELIDEVLDTPIEKKEDERSMEELLRQASLQIDQGICSIFLVDGKGKRLHPNKADDMLSGDEYLIDYYTGNKKYGKMAENGIPLYFIIQGIVQNVRVTKKDGRVIDGKRDTKSPHFVDKKGKKINVFHGDKVRVTDAQRTEEDKAAEERYYREGLFPDE